VYRHRSVSLNNGKFDVKDKIEFCEKTAGLRSGDFSDLNLSSVLESVSSRKNISDLRHATVTVNESE
jgi:hypothetical protein